MENLIQLLGAKSYIVTSKPFARLVGLHEALILGELIAEFEHFERSGLLDGDGMFYCCIEKLEHETTLARHAQNRAIKSLENLGFITTKLKGLPARRYFSVNRKQVCWYLTNKLVIKRQTGWEENSKLDGKKSAANNNELILTTDNNEREDALAQTEPSNVKTDLPTSEATNVGTGGVGVTTSNKKRDLRSEKRETLFRETEYGMLADGLERFKRDMVARNAAFELADLEYYYHTVLNWSDQNDNRKVNWLATAGNFILGDEKKGGFKKQKTNLQNGSSTTTNGVDLDRARARAERIAARFGE
jgi:hypothetical protein